jgi:hypothetical protein
MNPLLHDFVRLKRERNRLAGLVDAVESIEPDECFTRAQVAFRRRVRRAQDEALGSRELLRERLVAAADALKFYASQPNGEQARAVLYFVYGSDGTDMSRR